MSRELLGRTIEGLMDVCNDVYRHIDREGRSNILETDYELVKTFHQLVEINQRNLDILYPDRKKVDVKILSFRNIQNDIEEMSKSELN